MATHKAPSPQEKQSKRSKTRFLKRPMTYGIGCGVVILLALLFFCSPAREDTAHRPPRQDQSAKQAIPGTQQSRPVAGPADAQDRPSIQAIRFLPPQPTKLDTLTAEVTPTTDSSNKRLTYTYQWRVNNQIVEDASGATLTLNNLKMWDIITVTITPFDDGIAGYPLESPVITVQSVPPALALQTATVRRKAGMALDIQLVATDPDGDAVTFGLEPPLVEGMSIDKATGKITWTPRPDQRGRLRFSAFAEDSVKTKTVKSFEITLD